MASIDDDQADAHPAPYRLEALAAGDADAKVSEHVASCEACAGYLKALREEAQAFRARPGASGALRRAVEQAERASRSRRQARAVTVAGPLLAAAVVLLVVRARSGSTPPVPIVETLAPPGSSGEMRFKGELSVAAIRERAGRQDRLVGPFAVRASDAVRVEVSVDQEGPLTAGLLTDEGEWVVLLAPASLGAGTHYSERAARFDATPTHATLLVGAPAAVDRARRTRDFAGLVAWRVTSER
ncbi:MAG TPA: hypothetical protein VGM06_19635 [Polyangiaceae bacterium]